MSRNDEDERREHGGPCAECMETLGAVKSRLETMEGKVVSYHRHVLCVAYVQVAALLALAALVAISQLSGPGYGGSAVRDDDMFGLDEDDGLASLPWYLPERVWDAYRWARRTRLYNRVMELVSGGKPSVFNDESYALVVYGGDWRPAPEGVVPLVDIGTSEYTLSRRGVASEHVGVPTETDYPASDLASASLRVARFLRGYRRSRHACRVLATRLGMAPPRRRGGGGGGGAEDEAPVVGTDGSLSFDVNSPYFCVNMPLREYATGARSHYTAMDIRSDVIGDMRNEALPASVVEDSHCDMKEVAEMLVEANRRPVAGGTQGPASSPQPSGVGYYRSFMLARDMQALGVDTQARRGDASEAQQTPQSRVSVVPYQSISNFTKRLMEESSRCQVRQRRCVCGPEMGIARPLALSVGPQRAHMFMEHRMRSHAAPVDAAPEVLADSSFLSGDRERSWCPLHAGLDRVARLLGEQLDWDPRTLSQDKDASNYVYYVSVETGGQTPIAQDKWDTTAAKEGDVACIARCNRLATALYTFYRDNSKGEQSLL